RGAKKHIVPSLVVERPERNVAAWKHRQPPALTEEYERERVAGKLLRRAQAQYRTIKLGIDRDPEAIECRGEQESGYHYRIESGNPAEGIILEGPLPCLSPTR